MRYRVTESREQISSIQKKDPLTGLYNQEAFREAVVEILAHSKPDEVYAIEYMDINNFGYINENYGYKVGDSVLKMFAQDIFVQEYFRAGCRLYSDFFLLLIADESQEKMIDRLHSRNKRFTNMQNHRYPNSGMGVSAGVYILEDNKMDIEFAIENANLAWKNAKNTGKRDITLYNPSLRIQRTEEQKIVGEFYEALYRDDFQMYLQPKFILGDRSVYGAEALARWKRPDGKILPPGVFIDSLEKIGYITELDFYIYEEVLKTLEKWQNIIYVDADIICLKDISPLLNQISSKSNMISAAPDVNYMQKNRCIALNLKNHIYFNSGFLIINTFLWKSHSIFQKSLSILEKNPTKFSHPDQDVLNILLTQKTYYLPQIYNCIDLTTINHKDIVLLHFAANPKPWNICWSLSPNCNEFNKNLY